MLKEGGIVKISLFCDFRKGPKYLLATRNP